MSPLRFALAHLLAVVLVGATASALALGLAMAARQWHLWS